MERLKRYYSRIYHIIMRPEMKILPGQLAFFIVLAIFPMLTLFGYVVSKISLVSTSMIVAFKEIFPKNILEIWLPFITESHITGSVMFFMIVAFVLISNGTHSIIVTSNELYEIKHDDYVKRRIKALFMIVILMVLVVFMFLVLAYGNIIVNKIIHLKAFADFSEKIYHFFVLLKWPIAFIFIFIIVKLLYAIAPDKQISSKFMNKGALFTTVGWMITTAAYSYYVSNFANYTMFYGSISGIVVMMTWVYILSFILVMGIAINAEVYTASLKKYNSKEKKYNN